MEPTTPLPPNAARSIARSLGLCLGVALLVVAATVGAPGLGHAAAQTADAPADSAAGGAAGGAVDTPADGAVDRLAAPRIDAAAGILVDAESGAVIWAHNAHQPRGVASTTKILTALVAEDTYAPDELLTVPEAAVAVEGSRLGVEAGMRLRRDDLLTALLLVSGNDAAEVLAANHPAGREGFLEAMQATCELLGCTDSTWRDPSGLDAPGHRASAADLAIVSRALLERPLLAEIVASPTREFHWPDGRIQILENHNKMVRYDSDPGTVGVKTGFTTDSGHTLVSAQRRGDQTLIAVVLKSTDHYGQVRALFAYGFAVGVPEGAEAVGLTPEEIARIQQSVAAEDPDAVAAAELADTDAWQTGPLLIAAGAAITLLGIGVMATVMAGRRARGTGYGRRPHARGRPRTRV